MKRPLIVLILLFLLFLIFFYFSLGTQPKIIGEEPEKNPTVTHLDTVMKSYPNYVYLEGVGYVLKNRRAVLLMGKDTVKSEQSEAIKSVEKELESYWKWQVLSGRKNLEDINSDRISQNDKPNIFSRILNVFKVADAVNVIVDTNKTCDCDGGLLLLAGPDLHKIETTLNPDGEIIGAGIPHFDPNTPAYKPQNVSSLKQVRYEPQVGSGKSEVLTIGIIDSGINSKDEPFIANHLDPTLDYNFVAEGSTAKNDVTDPNSVIHGTKIARIIVKETGEKYANNLKIVGLKTFDSQNVGNLYDNLCAILYAIKHKMKVVNASWGGKKDSPIFREVMRRAVEAKLIVVCSAGNEKIDVDANPYYPACYTDDALFGNNVVTVTSKYKGAVCMNKSISAKKIDLSVDADTMGITCLHVIPDSVGKTGSYEAGTSYAAPYVVAEVVKYIQGKPVFVKPDFVNSLNPKGRIRRYTNP